MFLEADFSSGFPLGLPLLATQGSEQKVEGGPGGGNAD